MDVTACNYDNVINVCLLFIWIYKLYTKYVVTSTAMNQFHGSLNLAATQMHMKHICHLTITEQPRFFFKKKE